MSCSTVFGVPETRVSPDLDSRMIPMRTADSVLGVRRNLANDVGGWDGGMGGCGPIGRDRPLQLVDSAVGIPKRTEMSTAVSESVSTAEGITTPPIDELLERTQSKYALVIIAA